MPKRPVRLAFVLSSFARGGMEMRLADVVHGLDPAYWNPHVYALYDRATMGDKLPAERLHLPYSSGAFDPRVGWRLARAFRQSRTQIVWALAQGFAALWGRLAALGAGVPVRVLSVHGDELLTPYTRALNPWTDAIVTNSVYVRDRIAAQGVPAHKLHVLYNGIDTTRYAPGADRRADLFGIPAARPVILNVGRLAPEKGRDVMLHAARLLVQQNEPPLIVFAGEGRASWREALEQLAADLGITQHVRFLGIRDDVPDLLRASDVVVMSSRRAAYGESCPNVVLEAMATGKPIIGTDVGGTRELIQDGSTGYLIPPEEPTVLAARLEVLLNDPAQRQALGALGLRQVQQHFSFSQMIAGRHDLLQALLTQKGLAPHGLEPG
ncbi:MAG: glycosyltransferase [Anaerolineales bacterium]